MSRTVVDADLQSIQQVRRLIDSAHRAWSEFEHFSEEQVERILAAMAERAAAAAGELAEMAVRETGFGNVPDKTAKNLFAANDVYRAMRGLKTVGIVREDAAEKVMEVASPVGVIAGIIPSTNPTSTTIYKALIALKGRNAIVFSPHPAAVGCIGATVRIIAEAAEAAGAPAGVVAGLEAPSPQAVQELMKHARTALILATGGPGLVRAAYSAGKPAFGVGPGNVPAYVDRTADPAEAVRHILTGKCFDHGTLCSSEQAVVCDREVRDAVLAELARQGAHICSREERDRLEALIRGPRGGLNTQIVGQAAARIAAMAGIDVPSGVRALVAEADGVGPAHPISMEKLSPILAFYTVGDWREGCRKCIEILNFGGLGHTLGLHANDAEVVRRFALEKPASRICVNTPAALGAVGYTTNLFPAMTLGCGAFGGNITSDNISPLHLINLKRVAFGVREAGGPARPAAAPSGRRAAAPPDRGRADRTRIAALVDGWLARPPAPPGKPASCAPATRTAPAPPAATAEAPPLESYAQLETAAPAASAPSDPVGFVCEDDVRSAARSNGKIPVNRKTIITPSARDLGEQLAIFVHVE